ncbi:MAG: hypothetical protein WBX22_21530 [Silvibacterium sp.]
MRDLRMQQAGIVPPEADSSDNYFEHTCIPSSTTTNAFPTLITDPLGNQVSNTYYSCMRVPQAAQDANDLAVGGVGTTFTYDVESRPLCTNYPDGGQSCISYPNANTVQTTRLLNLQGASDQITRDPRYKP